MTKHIGWSYRDNAIRLHPGVDWSDPMVRVDVRLDARALSSALRRPIAVVDACGATVDKVDVPS